MIACSDLSNALTFSVSLAEGDLINTVIPSRSAPTHTLNRVKHVPQSVKASLLNPLMSEESVQGQAMP